VAVGAGGDLAMSNPLPAPMCPTERERGRPAGALGIGETAVGSVPISLKHAREAPEKRDSMSMLGNSSAVGSR